MATATKILHWLAIVEYGNAHGGDDCPESAIPAPGVLVDWLPECPADAARKANELLSETLGRDEWWDFIFCKPPDPEPEIKDWRPRPDPEIERSIEAVHERWLSIPEPDRPRHPLAPLVAAWQARPERVVNEVIATLAAGILSVPTLRDGPTLEDLCHAWANFESAFGDVSDAFAALEDLAPARQPGEWRPMPRSAMTDDGLTPDAPDIRYRHGRETAGGMLFAGGGAALEWVHRLWLAVDTDKRPTHPVEPLVRACLEIRMGKLTAARVTAAHGMTRRAEIVSTVRRLQWEDAGSVEAAYVDGEPIAARLKALIPDAPERIRSKRWRTYQPSGAMKLPGIAPAPVSLRMAALEGLPPILAGDVLTLLSIVHAVNPPGLRLTDREGAALLARTRDGEFRRPQASDIERYRAALSILPGAVWYLDSDGLWNWRELAIVATFPDGTRQLCAPAWMRATQGFGGRWTLTAEGGAAGKARIVAGEGGAAGRVVTGIEYRLAARFAGRPGIAPDLRPVRKGGPGPIVTLDWREVMRLTGNVWDVTAEKEDRAILKRFHRAVDRLDDYKIPGPGVRGEAKAGDSIEIVGRRIGGHGRSAALMVRASARFVEAARLASLHDGRGFETVTLLDWFGGDAPWTGRKKAK